MKCFVTGATGVVGRPLVPRLVAAGHEVVAVARSDDKAASLCAAGAEPVDVDLFEPNAVLGATEGCDAILHLATNVPPASKAGRPSSWALHNRLRTEATAILVAAAEANDVTRLVKESITFVYPDHGEAWIIEAVAPDPTMTALAPTLEGEQLALAFADRPDRTAVVLRYGLFYGGARNRGTDEMLRLARWRLSTVAGRLDARMSSVHVDDAATAVLAALHAPTGIYNVVDDEPLTRRDYLAAFSAAYGLPKPRTLPAWMLRVVAGRSAGALVASQRVSNQQFRTTTGWIPAYPSAREGWAYEATRRTDQEDPTHV
ncbi:MAG: NAD-dependent epimerase/dehydratase family protein [Acidimicrobiia bacterium]